MANERIVALSHQLRDAGVNVSIRSTKTACEVWDLFKGENDLNKMETALKSVYIKDPYDEAKFDRVFDKLFSQEAEKKNKGDDNEINSYDDSQDDAAIQQEDIMGIPDSQTSDLPIESMIPPEFDPEQLEKNKIHDKDLLKTDIGNTNKFDERILNLCRKLGEKIKNRRNIRKKHANARSIDMPRTIRSNLKNGGKLIKLYNCKPPLHKNKHVFLSDVSGSCDWISSWFFAILFGCQKSFNKISSYEFDNSIIETTDALKLESYYDAYQRIYSQRMSRGMIHGKSDMANSFKEFLESAPLNHRSIVIILTDCRDWSGERIDGELESAKLLRKIVERSSRVLIFNPEVKKRWNTPTSCVSDYQNAGAEVHEIQNLENLAKLITEL